jgi:hypothetical protein
MQCDFDSHKCNFDTHESDLNTHKNDFYTQSVIYTRRVRFPYAQCDCTRKVCFLHTRE